MQRQCSTCRRKWSYVGLERRWLLAQLYSRQRDCHLAARDVGVSSKTAAQIYTRFRTVLRFSDGELWRKIHPFRAGAPPAGLAVQAAILRTLYQELFLPRIPIINASRRGFVSS